MPVHIGNQATHGQCHFHLCGIRLSSSRAEDWTSMLFPLRCRRQVASREETMAKHKIALIPGDGIGKEVLPEGVRVLEAAARRFNFQLAFTEYDWSCDRFAKTGKRMPDDGMETLKQYESIFRGAVGWPGVPDHVSLWGLLIPIRREFDEYVNLRPVRLFEGVPSPRANRKPGDIDFWVVRENTEGEYSSIGGRMFQGTEDEMAMQQAIFT